MFGHTRFERDLKTFAASIDALNSRMNALVLAWERDAKRQEKFEQGVDDEFTARDAEFNAKLDAQDRHNNAIDAALAALATSHARLESKADIRMDALIARVGLLEARETKAKEDARAERDTIIARIYADGHYSYRDLAKLFGVSRSLIQRAVKEEADVNN